MKERYQSNMLQSDILEGSKFSLEDEQEKEIFRGEWSFRKIIGLLTIILLISSFFFSSDPSGEEAISIVKSRQSESVQAGSQLIDNETNAGIKPKDFEIKGFEDGGNAKMLIWDFNSEDKDELQVFINGEPTSEPFILTNTPVAFSVPASAVVKIKGIKDSGGGISYAVKFPQRKKTIFNIVSINGFNTYTLVPSL